MLPKNADRDAIRLSNTNSIDVTNGTGAVRSIGLDDTEMRDIKSKSNALDDMDEFELAIVQRNGETVKRKRIRRRKKKNASPDKESAPAQDRAPAKEIQRSYMEPPSKRKRNSHLRYVE